jgi:hypothetical protein
MEVKNRKIKELIPAEYNPRELTNKQKEDLTASLAKFGLVDPIIVNTHPKRKNVLVGGHQRMKVWESMGNETIATVEVCLSLAKEKELNVRLNKNTGQFDMTILEEHFKANDLIEWGFEDYEIGVIADIDLGAFFEESNNEETENKTKIILEYSADDFELVNDKLNSINGSKEQIVWKLLGLDT